MDHLRIDADAGTSGKAAVAEERRARAAFFNVVADLRVELLCRDPFADHLARNGDGLAGNSSGFLHLLYLLGIFDENHFSASSAA